ncbi:MAG: hypothetical protein HQK99_16655 [Nitrospirae bacterium]|nr:hypothetical protein [Nitrospirota bacterium]
MKKTIIMMICLLVLSAALSTRDAYSWYTDCNVTSARDTSFTNPGSAQPPGGEQYCGMVFFRIKKEVGKPPEAEVLKGNFSEVLKEAPKPAKEIEVEEKTAH